MSQGINFVKSYLFALSLRKGGFVVFGGMDEWLYQQEIRFEDRSAINIHRMLWNRGICCVSFLVNFGSIFMPCITFCVFLLVLARPTRLTSSLFSFRPAVNVICFPKFLFNVLGINDKNVWNPRLFFQLNVAVLVKLLTPTQDVRDGYDYEEMK